MTESTSNAATHIRKPVIEPDPSANATALLKDRLALSPDAPLFATPSGEDSWNDITTREFHAQVIALAKGLVAAGVEPGDKIALMSKVRYEWTLIDFATWFAGATLVPVYETSAPSQVQWIVSDSGATRIILETADMFNRFDEIAADVPNVQQTWRIDLGDLDKLAKSGTDVSDEEIERRSNLAQGSDLATLIYTSGSTGKPKGVVLTHSNFVELSRNSALALNEVVAPGASTLLFITTAHVFARFISVLAVTSGVKVGHQPDTSKLVVSMGTFKPTFLLAVPRVFEKVFNVSEQKAEAGGKGKIFRRAADVAVAHSKATDAGKVPFGLALQFKLFDALVYKKLKTALGGRVRYAVSGSAPLSTYLGHFYRSLGIRILEGYGLTETTAPASVNLPDKFKIGTVGPVLPGVGIKIDDDGEVLVAGQNVFKEYWNNPEATAEVFDGEWFHTGDIGTLDSDGYLTITGRKKELLVTAGGKNVAPTALEDPIRANLIVGQVVAVGDQKPFIAALVTLDAEMLPVWAKNQGLNESMTLEEAVKNEAVIAEVRRAVAAGNSTVSRAESVKKFLILPDEFTESNGLLTPKMSIKRHNVHVAYEEQIAGIYRSENPLGHSVD
ncbi:AMP-dependent synthetase/ligase [Humidisolicoccus flavus]|uniref:AMP-dependent synthetase/ligase n=1 Tax=Humidisolicoccus flavus TaxID=3111414 RepID=UPI00324608D3